MNDPARPFPAPDPNSEDDIGDVRPELYCEVVKGSDTVFVPDLRKIGILGRRWLVSRKRNTNLYDLSQKWKKVVFETLDEQIQNEGGFAPTIQDVEVITNTPQQVQLPGLATSADSDEESIQLHRRSRSPDNEQEHPEFGRLSKRTN